MNISTHVITCRYERNILERDVQQTTRKTKSAQNLVELTLLKQFYLEYSKMKHLYYSMNTVLAVELQKRALYTLHDKASIPLTRSIKWLSQVDNFKFYLYFCFLFVIYKINHAYL